MNNEWESMWKETIVAYSEALSWAKIWTQDLQQTKQESYPLDHNVWWEWKKKCTQIVICKMGTA